MNGKTGKRGRPRSFDAEEVLTRARDVFWAAGFSGSSLDDLGAAMAMLFSPAYAPAATALRTHVTRRLDWLVTQLSGSFLTGERFTVTDAYLFVCLNWSPWLGIDLDRWPALVAFMRRVAQRPKVQEALAAEDLVPRDRTGIFFAPRAMVAEEVRP